MLALPRHYIESLCEVKTLTNDLLAMGVIIKIDTHAIEIAANDDERMPLMQYRMPVKIFVHSYKYGPQILAGVVYLSTENFLRLEEVKPLAEFERRGAFRVNTSIAGRMQPLMSDAQQATFDARVAAASPEEAEEILASTYLEVRVMDVSLTGVRLQSPRRLRRGERYFVEFSPLDKPMGFCIEVQRTINLPNGSEEYGCRFFDFAERQLDLLCRDLFKLQRIEKNRRRNAPV